MSPNERLVRELYAAVEAGADVVPYFHPEAEQIEYPSLMRPRGHRRDLAEMRAGSERGATIIKDQRYDVRHVVEEGEHVAVQFTWTATTAADLGALPAGTELVAHVAAFYDFRDGLVLRQSSYDCYEPIGTVSSPA